MSASAHKKVFISYSHKDRHYLDELLEHLAPLEQQGLLDVWVDTRLEPGDIWLEEIRQHLADAKVAILLVSASFLASKFITTVEVPQALEAARRNGLKILPLLLRPCLFYDSALGAYQALNDPINSISGMDPTKREQIWVQVAQRVSIALGSRLVGPAGTSDSADHTINAQGMAKADTLFSVAPPAAQGPPFQEALLPEPPHFVGRGAELDWLLQRLRSGGAVAISALRGMGGIGKTALAAVALRQARREGHFKDGIVVILCQGRSDALSILGEVLTSFHPLRQPPETSLLARLAELAHQLLDGKDVLIVLDNIEPQLALEQLVGPLRTANATILLTARQMLPTSGVPAEGGLELQLLAPHEALDLLAQSLGRRTIQGFTTKEGEAAKQIVATLGEHTLAVKLAGAYAAEQQRDLTVFAQELRDPQRALDLPEGETPQAVARILNQSIDALPNPARWLFIALAAFPTGEFGRQAALALANQVQLAYPEEQLNLLVRRALLDSSINAAMPAGSDRERLRLHALLRAFASIQFARWDQRAQDLARLSLARYYATATGAASANALGWDETNITGLLDWAQTQGELEVVAHLCQSFKNYWRDRWHITDAYTYLPWGLVATKALSHQHPGDPLWQQLDATLALTYGQILWRTGEVAEAERLFQEILLLRRTWQDQRGEGEVLVALGDILWREGQVQRSEEYFSRALSLARQLHDRHGEAEAWIALGRIFRNREHRDEAKRAFETALKISEELGNLREQGRVLTWLGLLAQDRGQLTAAESFYKQALPLTREEENRRDEAWILALLGQIAWYRGQPDEAERVNQEALNIFRKIQNRWSEAWVLRHMGNLAQQRGQLDEAEQAYREALSIYRKVRDRRGEGSVLAALGLLAHNRKQGTVAESYYHQALEIACASENRHGESSNHFHLAVLAEERGDVQQAEKGYRESLRLSNAGERERDIAASSLRLGSLLIRQQNNYAEGCRLLQEAKQRFEALGLPEANEARRLAEELGCGE
ncbi:MAG TPA: tetratricopeptide repeat protein [Ktedonobacterales bacterium]|jgi:tetratricopeptide (TPR) repeat protein